MQKAKYLYDAALIRNNQTKLIMRNKMHASKIKALACIKRAGSLHLSIIINHKFHFPDYHAFQLHNILIKLTDLLQEECEQPRNTLDLL